MKTHKPLKVGQEVYVVMHVIGHSIVDYVPYYAKVTKVLDKYFYLDNGNERKKFSLKTFEEVSLLDVYQKVYLIKSIHDQEVLKRSFTRQILARIEDIDVDLDILREMGGALGLGQKFEDQELKQYLGSVKENT